MFLDKGRNVIADVEDEPDGDKTSDTVEINLQEIAKNVTIEQSHRDFQISARDLGFTNCHLGHQMAPVIRSEARNLLSFALARSRQIVRDVSLRST
jgi:hypothetical protein